MKKILVLSTLILSLVSVAGKVTLLTMDGDGGYDISVLVNM